MRTGVLAVTGLVLGAIASGGLLASPGNVVRSKHNLSASGPSAIRATGESQVCVFCHTPHNSNPEAPLWNHATNGAAVYGTYGSSTFDSGSASASFNGVSGTQAGQPTGASRLCLSCHDGTIALGETITNGTIAMTAPRVTTGSTLGLDLANDHPVSFRRAVGESQVIDPAAGDAVRLEATTSFVQCTTCHDPHTEDTDGVVRKFLVKSNRGSGLCTTCHRPAGTGWSWASSPHATSTRPFTSANTGGTPGLGAHTGYGTVADNACESCHRSHTAALSERLIKATDPKAVCMQCHGTSPVGPVNMAATFSRASRHDLQPALHDADETTATGTLSGSRRHVTCADCHNPHASGAATLDAARGIWHSIGTNTIAAASPLAGVVGVEPIATPPAPPVPLGVAPLPTVAQTGYTVATATREYQVCFKCHSSYAFGGSPPAGESDVAITFSPNFRSFHPVVTTVRNGPSGSLKAPWTTGRTMYCSDCHGNNAARSSTEPAGPHGSSNASLLAGSGVWNATAPRLGQSTGFCFTCHDATSLRNSNRVHQEGDHGNYGCQACHTATPHGAPRPGLLAIKGDPAPFNVGGAAQIIRFRWRGGGAGPSNWSESSCYATCHSKHNNTSYGTGPSGVYY